MRKLALIALISLLGNTASFAAQFGLGATVTEDSDTLYFPIRTEHLILEPFIATISQKEDEETILDGTTYGFGMFFRMPAAENVSMYVGGKVAFSKLESSDLNSLERFELAETIITPTLGAEYSPIPNFSIALEHRINFAKGELETEDFSIFDDSESDTDSTYSESSVIARIFF
jgi:hypothetical protein